MYGWVLCELFRFFDRRFAFWVCFGWSLFGFASLYWVERFCLCVCAKRTVVAVSKETDSLTERIKRIEEDKTNGEEGVASRMQLPGHQM